MAASLDQSTTRDQRRQVAPLEWMSFEGVTRLPFLFLAGHFQRPYGIIFCR